MEPEVRILNKSLIDTNFFKHCSSLYDRNSIFINISDLRHSKYQYLRQCLGLRKTNLATQSFQDITSHSDYFIKDKT